MTVAFDGARTGPALRAAGTTSGRLWWFVVASAPAVVVANLARGGLPGLLGGAADLSVAVLVSLFVHAAFARLRQRQIDPGWFLHAWLFHLLAPGELTFWLIAYGVGLGVLFGSLVFGGTGRYLVSPALLGNLLASISYPTFYGNAERASWYSPALDGARNLGSVLALNDAVIVGAVSTLACGAGLIVLSAAGLAVLRIVAGAVLGAMLTAVVLSLSLPATAVTTMSAMWHPLLGLFPLCAVFIATDPTAAAATRGGRWLYGLCFGALVVTLRLGDPQHPEGTLSACLLAMLLAPLIDQCWQRVAMRAQPRPPA